MAEKGLELWPNIKEYIDAVQTKKIPEPKNRSFKILQECAVDPLFEAKVNAFISVAKVVDPFLKKFQSDAPILPFLCTELKTMVTTLLQRFVTQTTLDKANTMAKLAALDVTDKTLLLPAKKVDVGFVAKGLLRKKLADKKTSELQVMAFQTQTRDFLQALVEKVLDKSPIRYGLARNLRWLSPNAFINQDPRQTNKTQFQNCVQLLEAANRVAASDVDAITSEMAHFQAEVQQSSELTAQFQGFLHPQDRLDAFWVKILGKTEFQKLFNVVKMLLLLSHGQATVERGFSFNKEIMTVNLKERSLVAMRAVVDHVAHVGGIEKVEITTKMLVAAGSARCAYEEHLKTERDEKEKAEKNKKRKAGFDELEELKKKKQRTEESKKALEKAADEYGEAIEKRGDLKLLAKFNAMRKSAKAKGEELEQVEEEIKAKVQEIANAP